MKTYDLNEGALAPVADEADCVPTVVEGSIPEDLNGSLLRIGPNPLSGRFDGETMMAWWPGAAMVHAIQLAGSARSQVRYRNRWLRTRQWALSNHAANPEEFPDTNPNVNILRHAGDLLALGEGATPMPITSSLESADAIPPHSEFQRGMTGHPKIDPRTGELVWFNAPPMETKVQFSVSDRNGNVTIHTDIQMPESVMMHDFAITRSFAIVLDLGVIYDLDLAVRGDLFPIRWREGKQCRLGVVDRSDGMARWFDIAPCFIQHVVNAYERDEDTIVFDAVRYPWFLKRDACSGLFLDNPLGQLWRFTIDLQSGRVDESCIDTQFVELPRINEAYTGAAYRYAYAACQPNDEEFRGIMKTDFWSGDGQLHPIPLGDQNSEPIFVARKGAETEDDGYVLVCVYRADSDTSDLLVLDARKLDNSPIARISIPRRIPAGFHGAWV